MITIFEVFLRLLSGAVIGIFPFFVLSWMGRQDLAKKAFLCTAISNVVWAGLVVAVGFVIYAILNRGNAPTAAIPRPLIVENDIHTWKVTCIAGSLRGQTYTIGQNGIIIGRDYDCTIRLSVNANNVSRHHCSLRVTNGVLYLTDLGSRCGTFLSNGSRLYPQQMQALQNGSVFYLANAENQFQIIY